MDACGIVSNDIVDYGIIMGVTVFVGGMTYRKGEGSVGYIDKSLSVNEQVRERFRLHWTGHIWLVVTLLCSFAGIGIPFFILEWLRLRGVEMGVTTRRVVHKRGILGRTTEEMRLEAIEAIEIEQGGWGRLFGRGRVRVYGRGSSDVTLRGVRNPMGVKRAIETAMTLV